MPTWIGARRNPKYGSFWFNFAGGMKTPQATYNEDDDENSNNDEDEDNDGDEDNSSGSVGGGGNYSSRHIFSATINTGIGC